MADEKTNADEAPAPAAAAATGGGFKAWLPLIITILIMPALAYGVTQFVLLPQLQKGLGLHGVTTSGDASSKPKKEGATAKQEQVVMNKLLVNISGTMGARYLLVSLTVAGTGSDFKDLMTSHDAQLRDMAMGALATKTLADLEKPDARNLIRSELLTGFNGILGDSVVSDIYLTEFAIQ
jgi:flagellar FliL protein